MEKILTDNSSEKITVKWDGVAFALVRKRPVGTDKGTVTFTDTIILNPKEMLDLVRFAFKTRGME